MAVEGGQAKRPQDVEPARVAKAASGRRPGPASGAGSDGRAPAWLVPAYLGGLALLYLSERVVVTEDKLRLAFSLLGVALVVVATGLRFAPQYRGRGDRASIQRLLGYLSLVGLAGVAVYFATTSWGQGLLGIADLEAKTRENVGSLLLITWVTLIAASVVPMAFAEAALHPMRNSPHIEARRVTHIPDSFAFRISVAGLGGPGLVYSGDCGVWTDIVPLIKPDDTVLSEAAFGTQRPIAEIHLTADEAARLAVDPCHRR